MSPIVWIVLCAALGLLTPLVAVLGGEPFETANAFMAATGSVLAVFLYAALSQYWITRRTSKTARSNWPNAAAMMVPLVATCLLLVGGEGGRESVSLSGALSVAGCVGAVIGMRRGVRRGNARSA